MGRGGFATVYRGRQPAFQRDVAVKVLQQSGLDSEDRRRFERECKAMGALSGHPGIVTLYDAGFTTDERPYLVMAYAAGGTLGDQLRAGPLPWESVADVGIRLAGALETAHRSGVVHRDIKPANVLRSDFGVQLSDFGIARLQGGHETQSGLITASVTHAAPEILDGRSPTVQADVYSLGSTLYEAAAGRAAFVRKTDEGLIPLIRRVMTDPIPNLQEQGVPMELAAVIERAMAKDPSHRYDAADAMGHALQAAQVALGRAATDMVVVGPSATSPTNDPGSGGVTGPVSGAGRSGAPSVAPQPAPQPAHEPLAATALAPAVTASASSTDTAIIPDRSPPPAAVPPQPPADDYRALRWIIPTVFVVIAMVVAGVVFAMSDDGGSTPVATEPARGSVADSAVPTAAPESTEVEATTPPTSDPAPSTDPAPTTATETTTPATTASPTSTVVPPPPTVVIPSGPLTAAVVFETEVPVATEANGVAFRAVDAISFDPTSGSMFAVREPAPPEIRDAIPSLAAPAVFDIPFTGADTTLDVASGQGATLIGGDGSPYGYELDAEGMVALADGSFFLVSEGSGELGSTGSPFVHRFDAAGQFMSELRLPAWYLPNTEQTSGFTPRRGPHGIDRRPGAPGEVVLAIEAQLLQDFVPDAPGQRQLARLAAFDDTSGTITSEWGYPLNAVPDDVLAGDPTTQSLIVDMTTLGDDSLVVLEATPSSGGVDFLLYRVKLDEGSVPQPQRPSVVVEKIPISVTNEGDPLDALTSLTAGPILPDGRPSLVLTSDNLWTDEPTRIVVLGIS